MLVAVMHIGVRLLMSNPPFSHADITTLNEPYEDQYGNIWVKYLSKIPPHSVNRILLTPWTSK